MPCLLIPIFELCHADCTNTSAGLTALQLTKLDHTLNAFL